MASKDHYAVLEVPKTATADDIKKAYRRLAMKWHPDKNPNSQVEANRKFKEIAEAYEVLSNNQSRQNYDRGLSKVASNRTNKGPSFNFNFSSFKFKFRPRPADEVFREFFQDEDSLTRMFGNDSFDSILAGGLGAAGSDYFHETARTTSSAPRSNPAFGSPSNFSADFISGGNFGSNTRESSTTTKIINGKKTVTKKVVENGVETVTVYENNVLKRKTVRNV